MHPGLIMLFQELPLASIQPEANPATEEFRKACYLLQAVLQNFKQYYQQHPEFLAPILSKCLAVHTADNNSAAIHGILISILDIAPRAIPRLTPSPSNDYHRRLYLHYYHRLLETAFSEAVVQDFLEYFRGFLKNSDMEVETEGEMIGHDYFDEWLRTLHFPLKS